MGTEDVVFYSQENFSHFKEAIFGWDCPLFFSKLRNRNILKIENKVCKLQNSDNYIINCLSYLQYRFNKLFDTDKKRVLRTFCNTCAEHFRAVLMSLKTGRAFLSIRSTRICRPLIMSSSSLKQTTIDLLWHAYIITNMKVMVCFYQSFTDFSFKLYDTRY